MVGLEIINTSLKTDFSRKIAQDLYNSTTDSDSLFREIQGLSY